MIDKDGKIECIDDVVGGAADIAIGIPGRILRPAVPGGSEDGEIPRIDVTVAVEVTDGRCRKIDAPEIAGDSSIISDVPVVTVR